VITVTTIAVAATGVSWLDAFGVAGGSGLNMAY
jgi:hypothetical protein